MNSVQIDVRKLKLGQVKLTLVSACVPVKSVLSFERDKNGLVTLYTSRRKEIGNVKKEEVKRKWEREKTK